MTHFGSVELPDSTFVGAVSHWSTPQVDHGGGVLPSQDFVGVVENWTSVPPTSNPWGAVVVEDDDLHLAENWTSVSPPALDWSEVVLPLFDLVVLEELDVVRARLDGEGFVDAEGLVQYLGQASLDGDGFITGDPVFTDRVPGEPPTEPLESDEINEPIGSIDLYERDLDESGQTSLFYNEDSLWTYVVGMGTTKFVIARRTGQFSVFELYYITTAGVQFRSGFQVFLGDIFLDQFLNDWWQTYFFTWENSSTNAAPHQVLNLGENRAWYVLLDPLGNIRAVDFQDDNGNLKVQSRIIVPFDHFYQVVDEEAGGPPWTGYFPWIDANLSSALAWRANETQVGVTIGGWAFESDADPLIKSWVVYVDIDSASVASVHELVIPTVFWNSQANFPRRHYFQLLGTDGIYLYMGGWQNFDDDLFKISRLRLDNFTFSDVGTIDFPFATAFSILEWLFYANDHGFGMAYVSSSNEITFHMISRSGDYSIQTLEFGDGLNGQLSFNLTYLKDHVIMRYSRLMQIQDTDTGQTFFDDVEHTAMLLFDGYSMTIASSQADGSDQNLVLNSRDVDIPWVIGNEIYIVTGVGYYPDSSMNDINGFYRIAWLVMASRYLAGDPLPGPISVFIPEHRLIQRDD